MATGGAIGSELLSRMLAELDHLYSVDLTCDEHLVGYYGERGMAPLPGMGRRNPGALVEPG